MTTSFERLYPPSQPAAGLAIWLLFRSGELVVQEQDNNLTLLRIDDDTLAALPVKGDTVLYLGTLDGVPCNAAELEPEQPLPSGWRAVGIRTLFDHLDDIDYAAVGYAAHILRWQHDSHFCPVCGQVMGPLAEQWMRQCPNCGYTAYPPVAPAILVLIHDGPRVLLVHKPGWGPRFSIVAGFVEPAESLEQCVRREVREEIGVEIADITYVSSQPWPFPYQLMIGFTARYVGGDITPDQKEIDQAAWFHFDQLPDLPAPLSLSRQLIMLWASGPFV